jgi:hypothetical protein
MADAEHPLHHRESPATYRRRRIAAGFGALAAVGLAAVLLVRLGADAEEARIGTEAPATSAGTVGTTVGTTVDGSEPGAGASTTSTTALVIPGFATPQDYLACVKDRESRGDYTAVSPDGQFFGAYQIDQVTWNNTAVHAGLTNLYQVQPNLALPSDQDTLAMALLEWQGTSPWAGDC